MDKLRCHCIDQSCVPPVDNKIYSVMTVETSLDKDRNVVKTIVEKEFINPNEGLNANDYRLDALIAIGAVDVLNRPDYIAPIDPLRFADVVSSQNLDS